METKISILRQFGTEQFSMTVTSEHPMAAAQAKEAIAIIGEAVSEAFLKVVEREEAEKQLLISLSQKREATNKKLTDQLKTETATATEAERTVKKAEKNK